MPEIKEVVGSSEKNPQMSVETGVRPEKIVDLKQEVPIPREVEGWLEKLEKGEDINQNNSNPKGDNDSVLQPIVPAITKITLPTNKATFTRGFSKPMNEAWRWLSEFVLRIIKKNQGNVKFKEE